MELGGAYPLEDEEPPGTTAGSSWAKLSVWILLRRDPGRYEKAPMPSSIQAVGPHRNVALDELVPQNRGACSSSGPVAEPAVVSLEHRPGAGQ